MIVELTKGQFTLIDDIDSDLAIYSCNAKYDKDRDKYIARISIDGNKAYLHRIILGRILGVSLTSTQEVDHVDGDTLNNRRSNLRLATHSQNNVNKGVSPLNKLGIKGVRKQGNKFRARIKVKGKEINLGSYDTADEAYEAFAEAAKQEYGEFFRN